MSGLPQRRSIRQVSRRHRPEAQLQAAVVEHLRLRARPDVLWLHCPNGERRDKITGAKLKRMGVLAGASDFLLWHRGNSFALELKAPGGRPTEAQLDFLARFNEAGGHSACAEGVDRAVAVLESWQLLRGHAVTYGQVFQQLRRDVAARTRRPCVAKNKGPQP
jgi:VRR-NUC domain